MPTGAAAAVGPSPLPRGRRCPHDQGVMTRPTPPSAAQRRRQSATLLAGALALLAVLAWPVPGLVACFVLAGAWMLGEAEHRRLSAYQHHQPNRRAEGVFAIGAVTAAVGTAVAALVWPWNVMAGALVFVAVAALVSMAPAGRSHGSAAAR